MYGARSKDLECIAECRKARFLYMVQTPGNPCQCKVLDPSLIKKDSWNLVLLDLKRGMFCSFVQRGPPASVSKNYCFTLCKVLSDKYFSGCSPAHSFLALLDHLWIRESGWASITLFIKEFLSMKGIFFQWIPFPPACFKFYLCLARDIVRIVKGNELWQIMLSKTICHLRRSFLSMLEPFLHHFWVIWSTVWICQMKHIV